MLACLKGGEGKVICRVCAAHHFANQNDLRVIQNNVDVAHNAVTQGVLGEVAQIENVFYINLFTAVSGNLFLVLDNNLSGSAADNAKSEKGNMQHKKGSPFAGNVALWRLYNILPYIIPQNLANCKQNY